MDLRMQKNHVGTAALQLRSGQALGRPCEQSEPASARASGSFTSVPKWEFNKIFSLPMAQFPECSTWNIDIIRRSKAFCVQTRSLRSQDGRGDRPPVDLTG